MWDQYDHLLLHSLFMIREKYNSLCVKYELLLNQVERWCDIIERGFCWGGLCKFNIHWCDRGCDDDTGKTWIEDKSLEIKRKYERRTIVVELVE